MTRPSSAAALSSTVALLWPGDPGHRAYRVLPSEDRPHFLVPEGPRRAAATGLRALRQSRNQRSRLRTSVATTVFATAPARWLPGDRLLVADQGIDDDLSETLGRPVSATVHLGPERANRKPVLALSSLDGVLEGFAKVGVDALTDALVETERQALGALAQVRLASLTAPRLIVAGSWQSHPYLLVSPLPVTARQPGVDPGRLSAAQVELARALGTTSACAGSAPYVTGLVDRLNALGADGAALATAVHSNCPADQRLEFGTWHGDWRAANYATTATSVLLWDWERFATGVPVGFDALHLHLTAIGHTTDRRVLARQLFAAAPAALRPFGVDRAQAVTTTTLYLGEIAARYLTDRQHETAARLGDVAEWILPELQRRAAEESS